MRTLGKAVISNILVKEKNYFPNWRIEEIAIEKTFNEQEKVREYCYILTAYIYYNYDRTYDLIESTV